MGWRRANKNRPISTADSINLWAIDTIGSTKPNWYLMPIQVEPQITMVRMYKIQLFKTVGSLVAS